jgi:ring-1,2-phenylacetyl-CoA epoxidase subunit PaaD
VVALQKNRFEAVWQVLRQVMDPEVPVISVVELGIVRDVVETGGKLEVIITPTYSGCPATVQIENDIRDALDEGGFETAVISTRLSPAWTSDWITEKGRTALREFGIAPPDRKAVKPVMFGVEKAVRCPHCSSLETEQVSEFGSTACKALWKCHGCREPFDYFKCI